MVDIFDTSDRASPCDKIKHSWFIGIAAFSVTIFISLHLEINHIHPNLCSVRHSSSLFRTTDVSKAVEGDACDCSFQAVHLNDHMDDSVSKY